MRTYIYIYVCDICPYIQKTNIHNRHPTKTSLINVGRPINTETNHGYVHTYTCMIYGCAYVCVYIFIHDISAVTSVSASKCVCAHAHVSVSVRACNCYSCTYIGRPKVSSQLPIPLCVPTSAFDVAWLAEEF